MRPDPSNSLLGPATRRLAAALTSAGPLTSAVSARAGVQRVRAASDWAARRIRLALPEVDPELLRLAQQNPLYVVDRKDVAEALSAPQGEGQPPSAWALKPQNIRRLGKASANLQLFWVAGPGRPAVLLCAPNIWYTARKKNLDQTDYAKWIGFQGEIWRYYFAAAPWLPTYLAEALRALPATAADLSWILALLSAATTVHLRRLTPAVIPSVRLLEKQETAAATLQGIRYLPGMDQSDDEAGANWHLAERFFTQLESGAQMRAAAALLVSADELPRPADLERPGMWPRRIRLG